MTANQEGTPGAPVPAEAAAEETGIVDLDAIAAQLGPFPDPARYAFEPEFQAAKPRPIPPALRRGGHEQRWRSNLFIAAVLGAFFWAISRTGWLEELSYYILPLKYLDWAGMVTLGITAIAALYHFLLPGVYRYVREGNPMMVRVLSAGQYIVGSGDAKRIALIVYADGIDLKTSQPRRFEFRQPVGSPWLGKDWDCPLKAGDPATAVYLGDQQHKARLYGFMRINPDVNHVYKKGRPHTGALTLAQVLGPLIGFVGLLWILMFGIYALQFYWPTGDFNWKLAIGPAIGAVVLTLLIFLLMQRSGKRENARKFVLSALFIGVVLGGIGGLLGMVALNATLDRSPRGYREFRVISFWQSTSNGILRDYSIEYEDMQTHRTDKQAARVVEMGELEETRAGAFVVREGAFGWSWIQDMRPLIVVEADPGDEGAHIRTLVFEEDEGTTTTVSLKLQFDLEEGESLTPSPALCGLVWTRLFVAEMTGG